MTTPPPPEGKKSFWTSLPGLATAAGALLTAVAALIGALAAAGVIGATPSPVPVPVPSAVAAPAAPTSSPTSSPAPDRPTAEARTGAASRSAEPADEELAEVELTYSGDSFGCLVQLNVNIGGQTAQPTGNSFTIDNVPTGAQHYSVKGRISCQQVGQCTASGSGTVSVYDGASYAVTWLNTAVGRCAVTLSE